MRELPIEDDLSHRDLYHKYLNFPNQRKDGIFDLLKLNAINVLTDEQEDMIAGSLVAFLRLTNIRELQTFNTPELTCQDLFQSLLNPFLEPLMHGLFFFFSLRTPTKKK